MKFGFSAILLSCILFLTACSSYPTSVNVQSAVPDSVGSDPTSVPARNPLAVALHFVTPTPAPTETLIPIHEAPGLDGPEPAPTKRASAQAVPVHLPLLPTISPDLIANLAVKAKNILRGDRSKPLVALTFDTGAGTPVVRVILQELREAKVHATFFLVGNWVQENPELVAEIARDGHDLANHSWNHPNFTELSDDQIVSQVVWTDDYVRRATGCTTRPFFRAPFGSLNNHVLETLARTGFESIFWSAHGGDWLPGKTMESVRETVEKNTGNGTIIVLHSSVPETAQAVPYIISDLRARGLELVRLSELLAADSNYPTRATCKPK